MLGHNGTNLYDLDHIKHDLPTSQAWPGRTRARIRSIILTFSCARAVGSVVALEVVRAHLRDPNAHILLENRTMGSTRSLIDQKGFQTHSKKFRLARNIIFN